MTTDIFERAGLPRDPEKPEGYYLVTCMSALRSVVRSDKELAGIAAALKEGNEDFEPWQQALERLRGLGRLTTKVVEEELADTAPAAATEQDEAAAELPTLAAEARRTTAKELYDRRNYLAQTTEAIARAVSGRYLTEQEQSQHPADTLLLPTRERFTPLQLKILRGIMGDLGVKGGPHELVMGLSALPVMLREWGLTPDQAKVVGHFLGFRVDADTNGRVKVMQQEPLSLGKILPKAHDGLPKDMLTTQLNLNMGLVKLLRATKPKPRPGARQ